MYSQIDGEPFKSNCLVHGYSGALKYIMWRKREGVELGEKDHLAKQALRHFLAMKELAPSSNTDAFKHLHYKVMILLVCKE